MYQNKAWENETGFTLDPTGRPFEKREEGAMIKENQLEFLRNTKVLVAHPKRKSFYAIVKLLPGEKYSLFTVEKDAVYVQKFYDHYVAPSKRAEYEVKLKWIFSDK